MSLCTTSSSSSYILIGSIFIEVGPEINREEQKEGGRRSDRETETETGRERDVYLTRISQDRATGLMVLEGNVVS